jgi:hypothetical protein
MSLPHCPYKRRRLLPTGSNRAGRAADCAGWIETLEGPFLGRCKAVGGTARARSHYTRNSCHFTRRVATGEHGTIRPWEVNRRVLSIVQNEAVARVRRVEVAAHDNPLRSNEVWRRTRGARRIERREFIFLGWRETVNNIRCIGVGATRGLGPPFRVVVTAPGKSIVV